jgi:hypothetical protein
VDFSEKMKILFILILLCYPIYMSIETWGMMPKSQEDAETIEEAIDRIVAVHEAAPTAHTGEGESLAAHRANEVIDHPAASVVGDKFAESQIGNDWYHNDFKSVDQFVIYGTAILQGSMFGQNIFLNNPTTEWKTLALYDDGGTFFDPSNYTIEMDWIASFVGGANKQMWMGMGVARNGFDPDDEYPRGIAFKRDGSQWSVVWTDSEGNQSSQNFAFTPGSAPHKFSIHYKEGAYIRWYIDETLVHEVTNSDLFFLAGIIFGISFDADGVTGTASILLYNLVIHRIAI